MAKLDLSLTPEELEAFLRTQRTIRVATSSPDGTPHVIPLWFVWVHGVVVLNSTLGNVTIRNLQRHPLAAGVIDDGDAYDRLRGVVIQGSVDWAVEDPVVEAAAAAWSEKYMGGNPVPYGKWRNRVWFRLVPSTIASWDFRKIPEARARARARAR